MNIFHKLKIGILICCLSFFSQANADSSTSYIFEEGGLDISGGSSESTSYILDHQTVMYDFSDNLASSDNYKEVTGYAGLEIYCGN